MPVKYDIGNVYDSADSCKYCGGVGFQNHAGTIGWRSCQYCVTGYKVRNCSNCHGQGCRACMGTMHSFYNELSAQTSAPILPDSGSRSYAGEAPPAPPRTILRR